MKRRMVDLTRDINLNSQGENQNTPSFQNGDLRVNYNQASYQQYNQAPQHNPYQYQNINNQIRPNVPNPQVNNIESKKEKRKRTLKLIHRLALILLGIAIIVLIVIDIINK